jgi:molecular chaperone GrpE
MEAILARYGVTRMGDVGDSFDPERHEAIAVVPGRDQPKGTIAEVARSGYSVDGRVLRPAQVAVARPPSADG